MIKVCLALILYHLFSRKGSAFENFAEIIPIFCHSAARTGICLSHEVTQMKTQRKRILPALLLTAATLWVVRCTAGTATIGAAAAAVRSEAPAALLRFALGDVSADAAETPVALSPLGTLALGQTPLLYAQRAAVAEAWSSELQQLPAENGEETEGTVLSPAQTQPSAAVEPTQDNGVSARTLRVSDASGYTVCDGVYINNASHCALDASQLMQCPQGAPRVLILHTHATEAYTMPAGEEYEPTDPYRTLDEQCNMLRIGEEVAKVLESYGIEVIHDTTLHDHPRYSGAYTRSLTTAERYLAAEDAPYYILDLHRDAVEDAAGTPYKLVCAEEPRAAQIEFVVGSPGGGAEHPNWLENLSLAVAVQRTLAQDYPTLMRPITVRAARYNQHLSPGALLVEVGTAGNSLDEALNAARLFAVGFAETILAEEA